METNAKIELWESLHKGTKTKIESIKEMIKEGAPYKEILSSKWLGKESNKEEWFEKFDAIHFFSVDDLLYLNMEKFIPKEWLEQRKKEEEQKNQEHQEHQENQETDASVVDAQSFIPTLDFTDIDSMMSTISTMNDAQRMQFISSPLFIKNLIQMLADYQASKQREILSVPDICRTEPVITRSMRVSDRFYQDFSDVCKDNSITLTVGLNCALLEFVKKYKK